jgi:hypothetical protein
MGSASVQRSGPDGLGWPELPREPYYQFRKAAHHRHAASFSPFFLKKTGEWFVSSHGCHRGNKLNGKQTPRAPWLACPAPTNQALTRRPQRDKVSGVLNDLRLRERERERRPRTTTTRPCSARILYPSLTTSCTVVFFLVVS